MMPEPISKLAFYLQTKEPLIYLFLLNCEFIEDRNKEYIPSFALCGVTIKEQKVLFYYNSKLFDIVNANQLYGVIVHEAYHIFKKHFERSENLDNKLLLNVAQDSVINEEIYRIKGGDSRTITPTLPAGCIRIPDDYKKEIDYDGAYSHTTEKIYYWLKSKKNETDLHSIATYFKVKKTGEYGEKVSEKNQKIKINKMTPDEILKKEFFKNHGAETPPVKQENNEQTYDKGELIPVFFDEYFPSKNKGKDFEFEELGNANLKKEEVHESEAISNEILLRDIYQKAKILEAQQNISREAGLSTGLVTRMIDKIFESKINWKKELRKYLYSFFTNNSYVKHDKKSFITYLRNPKSRYGILFKDNIIEESNFSSYIILAIDTSGSIFYTPSEMEVFFGEIEAIAKWLDFTKKGKILSIQWDTDIKEKLTVYSKGDWKKFACGKRNIYGGGGTNPLCVFNYLEKIYAKKNNHFVVNENGIKFSILDKKKLPMLVILTDGYFFNYIQKRDLKIYENNPNNVLFFTRKSDLIFEKSRTIIYK
jgi:predicted metal-dependent peptidase